MRKISCFVLIFLMIMMSGCKMVTVENVRVEDLDYTVVRDRDIPETLMTMIQEKKAEPFELTYEYEGYLYVVKGYGKQETGGYSISVSDLYLGKNAIYIEMNLVGPETTEQKAEGASYPYIVLKLENRTEPVYFQ